MAKTYLILLFVLAFALTGKAQDDRDNKVSLYPNPATSVIKVSISNFTLKEATVSVHSIIGNKLKVAIDPLQEDLYVINVEDLPPGYYLITIRDRPSEFNRTYKFLKK
ncbi:MAG: T9SS type A sorting domain-containing protein [Cyclobacteriaceae bacterium]|nr:T9SS type A sorting domain-containing protein [Cyclobacteriaceae bacterium]